MKSVLAAMLVLGPLAVSCTGQGVPQPNPRSSTPVPTVTVRISKPQTVTVQQRGNSIVVEPESYRLWAHGVIRDGVGAVCAKLNSPGAHYVVSDVSDAGLTMAITCIADGSKHQVRVIFVPDST